MAKADSPSRWRDIRGIGFAGRAPLARAWAWLDSGLFLPNRAPVRPEKAVGRVLSSYEPMRTDWPPTDRAAIDGFAVRAAETEGAGIYNPVPLALTNAPGAGCAVPVSAGAALPPGTDAVLAFSAVSRAGSGRLEVLAEAAPGEGVSARGSALDRHARVGVIDRPIRPQDAALLAMQRVENVLAFVRPEVRLVIPGPKEGDAEALETMLRALVVRDGGVPSGGTCRWYGEAIAAAAAEADVVLIAGRSGAGEDDLAAGLLVEVGGEVAMHGIAMRPGTSSGLGRLRGKAVLLLPGEPLACLTAYDMLAGRLIRRLGGFSLDLPYPRASYPLGRKIVSAIGFTDVVPVAPAGEAVVPIASAESAGLPASCRADGFVVVPETLEGHAEGETVSVFLYDIFGRYLYCWP